MSATEEPTKQLKQYKEFTTNTSIRKVAQEIIAPLIQTIEKQLSVVLQENQETTKKVAKLQIIFRNQDNFERRIEEAHRIIHELREENLTTKKQHEKRINKLEVVNQHLFLDIHSLKTKIQGQTEIIQQINTKNIKINDMYTSLWVNNEKTLKQVHQKYVSFSQEILNLTKGINQDHLKIQSEIKVVHETFKMQREAYQEKVKPLQLYISERQSITEKLQDLYSKIVKNITKEDLEGFRKAQNMQMARYQKQLQDKIEQILPAPIRRVLPSIQQKLREVQQLQKQNQSTQKRIQQMTVKMDKENSKILQVIETLQKNIQVEHDAIHEKISQKVSHSERNNLAMMEEKIKVLKQQIQEQMGQIIQQESAQLQKTLSTEIMNKAKQFEGGVTAVKAEQLAKDAEHIKVIFSNLEEKFAHIQEIHSTIDYKIQNYSSRITKIKSDYQLFADGMRKEVNGIIKFKQTFMDRLKEIGSLLSSFVQVMFINISLHVEKSLSQNLEDKFEVKQPIVFATQNDGIIYEWRPESKRGMIQYRKQKLEYKQFLLSYMYSLVSLFDTHFSSLNFLNWEEQKPSRFFYDVLLANYSISSKKLVDTKKTSQQCRTRRKSSTHITNMVSNQFEDQNINSIDFQQSKLAFNTIDANPKIDRLKQQNNNVDYRRSYSIKRQNLMTGKSQNKERTIEESGRYDKPFLVSRSGCRSRISQLF